MAAKTFDEFWEHESGWYDPNEPQGLSEYVLAQAAWNAAIAAEALKPSHNSGSPKCYCCGSENVIIECGSCKERRVFGTMVICSHFGRVPENVVRNKFAF
jgi:hypothetical protein